MHVLALDFDGVVADSAREAFAVALRTDAALREGPALAELDDAARLEDARTRGLFERFLALMPLGNRAEDYGVMLAALAEEVPLPDQAAYDAFHASRDPARLRAFHARFYEERAAWAARDPEGWRGLMPAYPGVPEALRRRAGDATVAIATAKDRATVRALLGDYGLAGVVPERLLLDKETGKRKSDHVGRLTALLGVPADKVTFVDDKLRHLEDVAPLGARCVLAGWGYNGEREHRAARAKGFRVCGLAEIETALFDEGVAGPGGASGRDAGGAAL